MRSARRALGAVCLALGTLVSPVAGEPPQTAVAINTFGTQFPRGGPVPLLVALGRAWAPQPVYVHFGYVIRLRDARGEELLGPVADYPPLASPEYRMQRGDEVVPVYPVRQLWGAGGIAEVAPDALTGYDDLAPGTYTLVASVSLATYPPESIFTRPEFPGKLFAPAASATGQHVLMSNPVTIELR